MNQHGTFFRLLAPSPAPSFPVVQDRFPGWQCAQEAGVIRFLSNTTDLDEGEPEAGLCCVRVCPFSHAHVPAMGQQCAHVHSPPGHRCCSPPASHLFPADGSFIRQRELCLEGVVSADGELKYNYTLLEDGCPEGHTRYSARRVPTTYLAEGAEGGSAADCGQ